MTRKERRKMMHERKKEGLKLTNKKHPAEAIRATLLGILSIAVLAFACIRSSNMNGKGGIELGFAGFGAAAISALGFIMAARSLKQDGIRYLFPTLASIINGFLLIFYVFIYFWGIYA